LTLNGYNLDIAINGAYVKEFDAREFTFSLRDSIHSLYPRGTFKVNDVSGYLLESRAFTEGIPVEITMGFNEISLTNKYLFHKMEVPVVPNPNQLSGEIDASLIHESYRTESMDSKSFPYNPSAIVNSLFNYNFMGKVIEQTKILSTNHLYQPRTTKEDFVKNVLLPNSLSAKQSPSPYYCFIDSKDILHYESLLGMLSKNPITKLYLTSKNRVEYYQKILSFQPFSYDITKHRNSLDFSFEIITDDDNKEFERKEISVSDVQSPYPLYNCTKENVPVFDEIEENFDESVYSSIINKQRYSLLSDRVLVTTPLHTDYCAGTVLELDTEYAGSNSSFSYHGLYLIEQSDHVWNGETQDGFTQMILARVSPTFSPDFELEGGMK